MDYNPTKCWADSAAVQAGIAAQTLSCHNDGQTDLGLCEKCHAEIVGRTEEAL